MKYSLESLHHWAIPDEFHPPPPWKACPNGTFPVGNEIRVPFPAGILAFIPVGGYGRILRFPAGIANKSVNSSTTLWKALIFL